MRVQLAVRTHETSFGGGHLPTGVDQLPLGTHQRHRIGESAHDVQLQFERRVGLTRRQRRMDGAAHRRIKQRGEPAAMDGAERVVVLQLRPTLKYGQPGFDVDRHKVERVPDRRVGAALRRRSPRTPPSPYGHRSRQGAQIPGWQPAVLALQPLPPASGRRLFDAHRRSSSAMRSGFAVCPPHRRLDGGVQKALVHTGSIEVRQA